MDTTKEIPLEKRLFCIIYNHDYELTSEVIYGSKKLNERLYEVLNNIEEDDDKISEAIKNTFSQLEKGFSHSLRDYVSDLGNMNDDVVVHSFDKNDYTEIRNAMLGKSP